MDKQMKLEKREEKAVRQSYMRDGAFVDLLNQEMRELQISQQTRKETAEKFAERLLEKAFIEFTDCDYDRLCFLIDEIAKELIEGK